MKDLMFKATDKAAWDAFALASGLTVADGDITFVAPGFSMSEIGAIAIAPPVFDAEGNLVTPAVMDEHHHVNVRVLTPVVMSDDEPPVEIDVCATLAAGGVGVVWLDPSTVSSPSRIWAGGMNYWQQPQAAE